MTHNSYGFVVVTLVLLAFAVCYGSRPVVPSNSPANSSNSEINKQSLTASQEPTPQTTIGSISDTVASLHRVKPDFVNVPPEARGLLTYFKHQIRHLISDIINNTDASLSARNLRTKIWDQLTAKGVTIGQPRERSINEYEWESPHDYGDLYDIKVSRPARHPELLAVTTELAIPCGSDSSLYLFQRGHQVWRLILAHEANGYSDVSGAQGSFDYRISFDTSRRFFVLTANVNPWCTSNWQSIRYAVLRPGVNADNPAIIIRGKETIYLGLDPPPYKLVVKRKSFSIRFAGQATDAQIMNGTLTRDRVIRYRINGNRPVRISR